jgi:flavin reductase (DIM6/NTAB) family NADH-FMN oxidoreductase RutF
MLCRVRNVIPDGDHAVVIGDVVAAEYAVNGSRGQPLIYYRRRLGSWREHLPEAAMHLSG